MSKSRETIREAAIEHLTGSHAILWGRSFDIIQNRDAAVEWLTDVVMDVNARATSQRKSRGKKRAATA